MWNDTDTPLAYLISFRTYGTWLHGDKRGSVNRFRNVYGTKYLPPEQNWLSRNKAKLKRDPVILDARQRTCVRLAIRMCCRKRHWNLIAINVRTNHVHIVVDIGEKNPAIALNAFKANATREMREKGYWTDDISPWADKGSRRPLWNEDSVIRATNYVIYGQGDDLPDLFE